MPVKGSVSLKRNVAKFFNNIEHKATERVLLSITMTAAGYAKLATPVDTATLINSQSYRIINDGKTGVVAYAAGFSETGFNYGLFLHENVYKDGSPVDWEPVKKKNATPHFLSNAFENQAYQEDYKRIIINGYKLRV